MKVIYIGLMYDRSLEKKYLEKSKVGLQGAINNFQWNFIDGFDKFVEVDKLKIFNTVPIGTYPRYYDNIIMKSREWSHRDNADDYEVGYINLPILKQISRYFNYKKEILKFVKSSPGVESIILYSLYPPIIAALKKIKKKYPKINISIIVTDIVGEYGILPKNAVKAYITKTYGEKIINSIDFVDSFILLTEAMKVPLKLGNKSYIVVEGIIPDGGNFKKIEEIKDAKKNKKIIVYTGTLLEEFGIRNLLKAFTKIDKSNYELWICGSGGIENEIIDITKKDSRIKFYGYVSKVEVEELQQQATILINPRPNEGEYTKYSFPSKTMEYMASGKPVLMYKLDGIPDEYDNFLYYVEGTSIENLKDKILEVCEKSDKELNEFGAKALNFVIQNKNPRVQAGKIFNLIVSKE